VKKNILYHNHTLSIFKFSSSSLAFMNSDNSHFSLRCDMDSDKGLAIVGARVPRPQTFLRHQNTFFLQRNHPRQWKRLYFRFPTLARKPFYFWCTSTSGLKNFHRMDDWDLPLQIVTNRSTVHVWSVWVWRRLRTKPGQDYLCHASTPNYQALFCSVDAPFNLWTLSLVVVKQGRIQPVMLGGRFQMFVKSH